MILQCDEVFVKARFAAHLRVKRRNQHIPLFDQDRTSLILGEDIGCFADAREAWCANEGDFECLFNSFYFDGRLEAIELCSVRIAIDREIYEPQCLRRMFSRRFLCEKDRPRACSEHRKIFLSNAFLNFFPESGLLQKSSHHGALPSWND